MFKLPAGTQALRRTVYCQVTMGEDPVLISIPNPLGALVLKGAAYKADNRDRDRHLDDAAVLAACVVGPLALRDEMSGHDRSRILVLHEVLQDTDNKSWYLLEPEDRITAQLNLGVLAANPQQPRFKGFGD